LEKVICVSGFSWVETIAGRAKCASNSTIT
jgi:hypothetical protein